MALAKAAAQGPSVPCVNKLITSFKQSRGHMIPSLNTTQPEVT